MDQMGLKLDWRLGVRLATAILAALVVAMVPALPAWAGYWTVPVNYYALEDVRYPLNSPQTGLLDGDIVINLAQAPISPQLFDGLASQITFADDARRGRVARFSSVQGRTASFIKGVYPPGLQQSTDGAISLSVWIKPNDIDEDQFVAAGGSAGAGYSLTLQNGRLVYTYWAMNSGEQPQTDYLLSDKLDTVAARASGWLNVVITQYRDDADKRPHYAALYVNGKLADGTHWVPAYSGLWFVTGPNVSDRRGYLGSANLSGYIFNYQSQKIQSYSRPNDKSDYTLAGLNTYFDGDASEFRLFAHLEMVCSDKTRAGYEARNHTLADGTRCDIGSDVSSISQDRIEPDSILVRMPFEQDPRDHHFAGLGQLPETETSAPAPTYVSDELRLYAARFNKAGVRYTSTNPNTTAGPYSVSFWLKSSPSLPSTIYRVGNTASGLNITAGDRLVSFALWGQEEPDAPVQCAAATIALPDDDWHHVVFSIDPTPWTRRGSAVSHAGLSAYLDGKRGAVKPTGKFRTDNDNINVGGADDGRDLNCRIVPLAAYDSFLSNLQVFKAPITPPQAAQLASRSANAAEAVYDRTEIDFHPGSISTRNGYDFRYTAPAAPPETLGESSALEFEFIVDFGAEKLLPRWVNPVTQEFDPDCEYVLNGILARSPSQNTPIDPQMVLFCFSPSKISAGLTPFTIGLFYPSRGYPQKINAEAYNVLVWEPLVPKSLLEALSNYGHTSLRLDLALKFRISVSAYNILMQVKTLSDAYPIAPNYVSPVYQGASALVKAVFDPKSELIQLITPQNGVTGTKYYFIDQRQQLDDFDVKLSKGY